jgi:ABC-2 type transport system ATP-binding protein
VLSRIGFLAQDRPLYRGFTVDQTLGLGARLNPRWDDGLAHDRVRRLGIPVDRKVGKLSGGQQAQVALTLALAKRPDILMLDEPVAGLDPLARRDFTQSMLEAAAEHGLTVIVSSHVVAELERFCDYLVVIGQGRIQLVGEVDGLIEQHTVLVGDAERTAELEGRDSVIHVDRGPRQTTAIVRSPGTMSVTGWESRAPSFEELVLAYMSNPAASSLPRPAVVQ